MVLYVPAISTIDLLRQAMQATPYFIVTDKDLHFTTAIAVNGKEDENIPGLYKTNKALIPNIAIQAKEAKHYVVWFFSKDSFDDVDLNLDAYMGLVDFDLETNGRRIGGANQYYWDEKKTQIYYNDEDLTKELHISLQNLGPGAKSAGVPGEVKLLITYLPLEVVV